MNKHTKDGFEPVTKGKIYLHVNNGGISLGVIDEGWGPTIFIQQDHFGAVSTDQRVRTTKDALRQVGEMFIKASQENFSKPYCETANPV